MRGGPGLGNIAPAQGDYNQIVHGGGHGEYHAIVLAPASVQESVDLTVTAFDLAEKYRSVVVILTDGSIGQMMEPCEMPPFKPMKTVFPEWATNGAEGRGKRVLTSINLDPAAQEVTNFRLMRRWQEIEASEVKYKTYYMEDAKFAVTGFGSCGRLALSAVRAARAEGIKVGLIRPITVSPFPVKLFEELSHKLDALLVVEMNNGQMLEDVLLATRHQIPVEFYGRMGGVVPFPDEVLDEIRRVSKGSLDTIGHPRDRWLKRMAQKDL
jgi:2-oxoglutarate ferredoxin oxidoreductase subunit alpha